MFKRVATSSSVAVRPSSASSSIIVRSRSFALSRTERGTQSCARSSSRMAPRIRNSAYVLNLLSRVGSYFSIASIRPITPLEIRSSSSMFDGKRTAIFCAMNLMSGAYSRMSLSFCSGVTLEGSSLYLRSREELLDMLFHLARILAGQPKACRPNQVIKMRSTHKVLIFLCQAHELFPEEL